MGPDHSQIEIYNESKHGVLFAAQRSLLKLDQEPAKLTTRDMFLPTCATCHLSGLNGLKVTHDTSERLSWLLAAEISQKRPNYAEGQAAMKEVCAQCHTADIISHVYDGAEKTVAVTNDRVSEAQKIYKALRDDKIITGKPFTEPVDFLYFDLWHYYGRTSKHGAFMGGADYTQWHGNYPLLVHLVDLKKMDADLRREHGRPH
jgi:hypothetical protein